MCPLWSILIPSLACRADYLAKLLAYLTPQIGEEITINSIVAPTMDRRIYTCGVEVITDVDNGDVALGAKRNRMLRWARGQYASFIDDDDLVAPDYCSLILKALEDGNDTVGFRLQRLVHGKVIGHALHSLCNAEYANFELPSGEEFYLRTPNHLNPTKTKIMRAAGFPEINWGEDGAYAKQVRPLLKTETLVPKTLYFYHYRPPEERTNEVTHQSRVTDRRSESRCSHNTNNSCGSQLRNPDLQDPDHPATCNA